MTVAAQSSFTALRHSGVRAYFVASALAGLYNMSSSGLRAFSGVTVGVVGSLIGIHGSLALSALMLLRVTVALLSFSMRVR